MERGVHDPDVIRAFGRPTMSAEGLLELNRTRWEHDEAATFSICDATGACVGHVFVNLSGMRRGSVGYWHSRTPRPPLPARLTRARAIVPG